MAQILNDQTNEALTKYSRNTIKISSNTFCLKYFLLCVQNITKQRLLFDLHFIKLNYYRDELNYLFCMMKKIKSSANLYV